MKALFDAVRNMPWAFEFGDPTLIGWLTTALYFVCMILCGWNLLQSLRARKHRRKFIWYWGGMLIIILLLGFNKQLDLQIWLTAFGKSLAKSQGWYGDRRLIQALFFGVLAGFTSILGAVVVLTLRPAIKHNILTSLGLFLLAGFVIIRAAFFHHMEIFHSVEYVRSAVNWILEIGGALCVCLGAGSSLFATDREI